MKILKKGKKRELSYIVTCDECDTKFSFNRSEGKFMPDSRDGDYLIVNCPVCKEAMNVDVTLGR